MSFKRRSNSCMRVLKAPLSNNRALFVFFKCFNSCSSSSTIFVKFFAGLAVETSDFRHFRDAITSACDVYKFDRLTPACFANELIERGTPGYWDLCKAITAPILSATFSVLLLFFMKDVNQPVQDMMSSLKPLLDHSLRLIGHKSVFEKILVLLCSLIPPNRMFLSYNKI